MSILRKVYNEKIVHNIYHTFAITITTLVMKKMTTATMITMTMMANMARIT